MSWLTKILCYDMICLGGSLPWHYTHATVCWPFVTTRQHDNYSLKISAHFCMTAWGPVPNTMTCLRTRTCSKVRAWQNLCFKWTLCPYIMTWHPWHYPISWTVCQPMFGSMSWPPGYDMSWPQVTTCHDPRSRQRNIVMEVHDGVLHRIVMRTNPDAVDRMHLPQQMQPTK